MARSVIPYSYRPGNSLLHRLPAGLKFLGLLGISLATFFFGPWALAGAAALILAGSLIAGIKPWELFCGSRMLLISAGLVVLIRSVQFTPLGFDTEGCVAGLVFAGVLMVSFCAASLLFSVTTMAELRDSAAKAEGLLLIAAAALLKPLKPSWSRAVSERRKKPVIALVLTLMLGFLPRFFEIWNTSEEAYRARGGRKGIKQILVLVPLVSERMLETAGETAAAFEARGSLL
ncbi:energy-coupling factor transporter transmembrane component T family protein [Breznakiella homolactica]|uniref:Energy-coupling factor transporter transmembrane protein EcfT n=1 Tax=Breznakiella homolactica TaxID=2798577 RepID=A0A7T7XKI6_9SPIR|nr:energy-coupling factor transporter transmembrane component T [Breznakiella homolactica]QQO07990.1 energy-coupling factor transporter transmembrane protein EcfT [Breznakiella homolactica]